MNPILKNQSIEVIIIRENTKSGKEFLEILHSLTRLGQAEDSEFEIRSLLSRAWMVLVQEIEGQRQRGLFQALYLHERTKSILSYIHRHYSEKITISDMAAHVGVSTKECIRSFKNAFHQTPMDYLISYRMEQAKRFLKETDETITDIAFLTGFHDSAYFSKTFKKYRKIHKKY